MNVSTSQEWLEADGRGGFASGTASGVRTRRYHALLLTAAAPPAGRVVLVNGFDAWIQTPAGRFPLTSQKYSPSVVHPDGASRIAQFTIEPWPTWIYRFEDGTELFQEIFIARDAQTTVLNWRLLQKREGTSLIVRPFLSGRDYHSLHKENPGFRFEATPNGEKVLWRPYESVPGIYGMYSHNGRYSRDPLWYRNFLYDEERTRGLDDTEDLASPGAFEWDLSAGDATWLLTTADSPVLTLKRDLSVAKFSQNLRAIERDRRAAFRSPLHKAADAYIVTCSRRREEADFPATETSKPVRLLTSAATRKTIIAGYPWFTDWGRDTFIALRGLCIAANRLEDARDILMSWTDAVSEGMLPNRFPDHGEEPEYNSVDASMWFIIAVHDLLQAAGGIKNVVSAKDRRALENAIEAILEGYSRGTRYSIRMEDDGLLAAGAPGTQLTWMDAKIGDWTITPRVGKPVEIQALWLNALKIASRFSPGWNKYFERGLKSFQSRFWNEERGCLFDVIDVDHQSGRNDASIRPNQILAVGGLPIQLLDPDRAARVVAKVQQTLLTPLGLRSLAPGEPGYAARYEGGPRDRDSVYHQGTVWPWLLGPFIEAWLRVHGSAAENRREAREQFLQPLLAHLDEAGLNHISEIADAEPPHTPRGCPFQAWSLGELLRVERLLHANTCKSRKRVPEAVAALTDNESI